MPNQIDNSDSGNKADNDDLILSYMTLRKTVGYMGMLLPVVLYLGGYWIFGLEAQPSLSDYYYTPMRGIFVGFLFAIGSFFFAYRGHDIRDSISGFIVSVCAACVALFPTVNCQAPNTLWYHKLHIGSAAVLLLTLAYIAAFLFTETHSDKPPTKQKLKRNCVYRICAGLIVGSVVGAGVYAYGFEVCKPGVFGPPAVLLFEATALMAFGFAWAVKGEAIFADEK